MIQIKVKGLKRVLKIIGPENLIGKLNNATNASLITVQNFAKKHTPVRRGILRNSWKYRQTSQARGIVFNKVKYGVFVNDGTGIYGPRGKRIIPVKAKALKFGGRYYKSVRGQKPKKFVEKAVKASKPQVIANYERAINNINKELGLKN